ncbi:hypothetical protein ACFYV7_40170 [Nocardia suismassiliense]|uniref:GNAT family N-acetyltransferase n=1 Tax=Nocardia suismassiliense TaxID=2077092 RepID=A0ABW6R6A8_9NOCA
MSPSRFTFRETSPRDQQFLAEMLIEAAHASGDARTIHDLPDTPGSYRYVAEGENPATSA